MLLDFLLISSYTVSSSSSLVQDKKISGRREYSTQGDPRGSKNPKSNKSNKPSKSDQDSSSFTGKPKTPVYPHPPVKVYQDADVSKSDIYIDFKDKSVIYM